MSSFRFERAEDFNPTLLERSLCMDFDAVVSSFEEDADKRIKGALSSYIYDMPQYPGDPVEGGIHYARYVKLPTSFIPQKQPPLLKQFASVVKKYIGTGASFFDLGPGPDWSVNRNTIPALRVLNPLAYFAIDIELAFTEEACRVIRREFPDMKVQAIAVDFHNKVLPYPQSGVSVVWYPGSTLGNLPSLPGQKFIENKFVADHLKQLHNTNGSSQENKESQHYLVLLMDSRKDDIDSMINLYVSPEARGCFLSILFKLRRDLQANTFKPESFVYNPHWSEQNSAVEHVFTALETQEFTITDCFTGREAVIKIHEGENYILANSIKPSCEEMRTMLIHSGWEPLESLQDTEGQFHIHLARAST